MTISGFNSEKQDDTVFRKRLSLKEKVEGLLMHLRVSGHRKSPNLNKKTFLVKGQDRRIQCGGFNAFSNREITHY